jgi:FkbM family methyltransferase
MHTMQKRIKIGESTYFLSSDDNYLDAMGDNFEPHMVELYRALIGPDDIVGDIGANIGLTAILFSSLAHKVFAFEPSPSTFRILLDNLAKANVTNVETINLGLGAKRESLTITYARNNRAGGYVSNKIKPEKDHVTEEIRLDTLDRYFVDCEIKPTFLKIDVEGFEQNVIEGGRMLLEHNKPVVILEMNHFCLDVLQRITIPDYLDFMRNIFPFLYAVDTDNASIAELHDLDEAYSVMYDHVVRNRFPNLVGGFDVSVGQKLKEMATTTAREFKKHKQFPTPEVARPKGIIHTERMPERIGAGDLFGISITVRNDGDETWYGYGTHPVYLCYHWKNIDGKYLIYDGIRTELKARIVHPGETIEEVIQVVAPSLKGKFKLILSFVQEGVCWFEDKGFAAAILELNVL